MGGKCDGGSTALQGENLVQGQVLERFLESKLIGEKMLRQIEKKTVKIVLSYSVLGEKRFHLIDKLLVIDHWF